PEDALHPDVACDRLDPALRLVSALRALEPRFHAAHEDHVRQRHGQRAKPATVLQQTVERVDTTGKERSGALWGRVASIQPRRDAQLAAGELRPPRMKDVTDAREVETEQRCNRRGNL